VQDSWAATGSGGVWRVVEAVRMADPRGVLLTIRVVLRGGSLLVLPWAQALVASGICSA